jgi:hypothetical protein
MISFAPFAVPLLLSITTPLPPEVWVFQGIEIQAKVGCTNNPVVEAHHAWLRRGANYEAERKALHEELRKSHGTLASINTFRVTAGKPHEIALVRKTLRCTQYKGPPKTVQSYRWHAGADRDAVLRELEANRKTATDVQSYEVVRWIDVAGELQELSSASVGEYREVITRTYGPLKVIYTSGTTASGRTVVHVRATNTDRKNAVLLQIRATGTDPGKLARTADGGIPTMEVTLQPGERFSGPIEATTGFEVHLELKDPSERQTGVIDGAIDYVKKKMRYDVIDIQRGRLRGRGIGGIRG